MCQQELAKMEIEDFIRHHVSAYKEVLTGIRPNANALE